MKALVIRPHQYPVLEELPDLEAMQECVGGYIETVHPWPNCPAVLVCDDEGMIRGKELNRYIGAGCVIADTFFICGEGEGDFEDLPDDLISRFEKQYHYPEAFIRMPNGVAVIDAHGVKATFPY